MGAIREWIFCGVCRYSTGAQCMGTVDRCTHLNHEDFCSIKVVIGWCLLLQEVPVTCRILGITAVYLFWLLFGDFTQLQKLCGN
ncbi:hypothetical protein E2C01_080279 [Portunus trituberculatus]|uniref:Uncharacterized protein n=1 Tax=Portunus trituberculatus TaxID=210409 RepID=A0A5B7ILS4_PORTR|nr:hypothetical protein [Portunus trituberculatus]